MQRLSYPTETVLSNKITRNIIVLSFKDSPRQPLRRQPREAFLRPDDLKFTAHSRDIIVHVSHYSSDLAQDINCILHALFMPHFSSQTRSTSQFATTSETTRLLIQTEPFFWLGVSLKRLRGSAKKSRVSLQKA